MQQLDLSQMCIIGHTWGIGLWLLHTFGELLNGPVTFLTGYNHVFQDFWHFLAIFKFTVFSNMYGSEKNTTLRNRLRKLV